MNENCIPAATSIPFWIVILCLLISLVGIADHDLWTPDEPREAAIMLSMSRTGNLIIPDLAGVPFVEKPPLYYIVGAGALRLLHPHHGAYLGLKVDISPVGTGRSGHDLVAGPALAGTRAKRVGHGTPGHHAGLYSHYALVAGG